MTLRDAVSRSLAGRDQALLAAALLSVTTVVRVPVELYGATPQDFPSFDPGPAATTTSCSTRGSTARRLRTPTKCGSR